MTKRHLNHINSRYLKKNILKNLRILLLYFLAPFAAEALTYTIPERENTIGEYKEIEAETGDTLVTLAEQFDIGVAKMFSANHPLIHKILTAGTQVIIPSEFTQWCQLKENGLKRSASILSKICYLS